MNNLYLVRIDYINENGGDSHADVAIVRGKSGLEKYAKENFKDPGELKLIPLDVKPNNYKGLNR